MQSCSGRIDRKALGALPDCPGVYLFYGGVGELLYVGKSKAIRTRVRSHFASPDERRLCRQVCHVEARPTAGELGALLLESQLIKELRPMFNIQARHQRRIIILRGVPNRQGYLRVVLEAVSHIDPAKTDPILAIFKHKTQAKEYLASLAKTHHLCLKLLGLEHTTRRCFGYHVGYCSGACVGEESTGEYNRRFENAFADRRIKGWPYSGAVIIEERAEDRNEGEVFLVDNWCLLYSVKYSLDEFELGVQGGLRFDYDSYKILCSYLLDDAHQQNVRSLTKEEFERITYSATVATGQRVRSPIKEVWRSG